MPLTDAVILAPATPTRNTIQPAADNVEGLIIRQHSATQSAPLLRWADATGSTTLGEIAGNGTLQVGGPAHPSFENQIVGLDGTKQTVAIISPGSGFGNLILRIVDGNTGGPACLVRASGSGSPSVVVNQLADGDQGFAVFANSAGATGDLLLVEDGNGVDFFRCLPTGDVVIGTALTANGGATPAMGAFGAPPVGRQVGASAAAIAAITDPNAKACIQALQTALANLGLVTSPA